MCKYSRMIEILNKNSNFFGFIYVATRQTFVTLRMNIIKLCRLFSWSFFRDIVFTISLLPYVLNICRTHKQVFVESNKYLVSRARYNHRLHLNGALTIKLLLMNTLISGLGYYLLLPVSGDYWVELFKSEHYIRKMVVIIDKA